MTAPQTTDNSSPLLSVRDLHVHFPARGSTLKAVNGVSFDIHSGQSLGLVGESGCGKTTVARALLRLQPATSGKIMYAGRNILDLRGAELKRLRREVQIIFQDPLSSLNPRMTIGDIVGEPLVVHHLANRSERRRRVGDILHRVGLSADSVRRYPHEFSGGQRQRIGIARALILQPKLVVCDEPVSALDVSIQSQIINLLQDLQHDMGLSFLFIAHNLAVVEHFCDEVAVMYLGKIVERAPVAELYRAPRHPYTQTLLAAVPTLDGPAQRSRPMVRGEAAGPLDETSACPLFSRCANATSTCNELEPALETKPGSHSRHLVACHHTE